MKKQKTIETTAKRLAAHNIKTADDFAAYCRPGWGVCVSCVALGLLALVAVSAPLVAAGMIPASWLVAALAVYTPIGAGLVFGLRAIL